MTTITLDPYHDAFHNEIGPFIQALSTFQARIASFDYPENTVLQKLVQISQKIQHLPLSSPLMRWLIGLETLLGKIQEWEQSAASFVSLKVEMAQLSRFVIRWRKFELESWSKVLDRRTNEARKRTSAMWFNMHENLLQAQQDKYWSRPSMSWLATNLPEETNSKTDQVKKPHLKVFQLIDEFCRLSTLGDFTFRCELLHAFANYCQVNGSGAQALAHTLRNLGLYYEQFTLNCKLALEQNRAPIQTKLENQVKISSWDDRNYFALKESADKSHRIILRLSKEFDTVLESPVHQVFTQTAKDYVAEEPKALASFVVLKSAAVLVELPESTNNEQKYSAIYRRAKELVEKRIATNQNLIENHEIPRELFEAIKDRLQSLDKDSPVQWKKRALVDLFNEFKLQLRGSPPIPHRLRDFREVFASELTLAGTSPTSLFAGLFHLNHLRNLVRSPITDRSEDLSMQECNRGVYIGETIMLMLLQQRETLVALAKQQQQLSKELLVWDKLRTAAKSGETLYVFDSSNGNNAALELELDLVLKGCRDLDFLATKLVPHHVSLRALQVLVGIQQEIEKIKLEQCCSSLQAEDLNARFRSEAKLTLQEVSRLAKQVPSCDKLVQKIAHIQNQSFHFTAIQRANGGEEEETVSVAFVQTCQIFIQPLAMRKTDKDDEGDAMLHAHHAWLLAQNTMLRPNAFVCAMKTLTTQALQGKLSLAELESRHSIVSLAKLAHHVLLAYYQAFLTFHNALSRLQEFILKLFRSVVEKGFCRPPEETEQEEGVDENLKDGTGMGEGQGQDNVSKEIEDEEQLLGLKGDKQEDGPEKNKGDKKDEEDEEQDGVEMENDFDGREMHDMDREDEQNEDDEDQDSDEDKEELDRDMGDTGDQSQTVDEKLWDEKEDEKTEDEKFEDNAPMKGEEQELRAKDEDENKPQQQLKKEEEKEKKSGKKDDEEEDQGGEVDDEEDDGEFKAEEMEENSGLDKEQDDAGQEEEEEAGDETIPEMEGKVDDAEPEDFEMPDTGPPENDDGDNDDEANSGGEDLNELAEEEDDGDEDDDRAPSPPPPEEEESDGKVTLPTQANEENDNKEEQDNNDDAFLGQGTTSTRNNNNNDNDSNQDQPPKQEDDTPGVSNQTGGTSGGTGGERFRKGGEPEDNNDEQDKAESEQNKRKDLNPWRDPGDASKEWSRRKKIIETVGQAEEDNNEGGEMDDEKQSENQTVEFKRKDGEDENEPFDQALGARDDEAADQEQVNMEDEMEDEEQEANNKKRDEDDDDAAKELNPAEKKDDAKKPKQQQQQRPKRGKFFDDLEESSSDDEKEEEQVKDRVEEAAQVSTTKAADPFLLFTKRDAEEEEDKAISMEEVEIANMAGDEVDNALLSDEALERGRALWQGAVNETFESAQHLCEQLRLVLEPTTATKLKGDYRTGTRINMRRVIAYIASGYKKDKIWQKRSKPSRRKYHIALAIDDSKSMKPCKDLALAALALITRALTQLEVGEVGIWSFGDDVKKLHDLSKPFSETSGALVSAHFGFDQNSTSIEQGLSTVIDTLSAVAANDSKMTEQPRQLVFVISDGRFDTGSRPRIAKLLRAAKERRQLVALIVVEPEEAAESILEVRQVSFRTDGTGGVTMSRYLEDYPFPYYIVLRDMKALPEVLADGLKQWFELIVGDAM